MKLDWQWPAAVVYAVVFASLGALVALNKLHPEVLMAMLTWLAPGPWQPKGAIPGTTTTSSVVSTSTEVQ